MAELTNNDINLINFILKTNSDILNVNVYTSRNIVNSTRCKIEKECPICYETVKINQYERILNCSHIYHKKCIDKWFKLSMTCPTCRTNYATNL